MKMNHSQKAANTPTGMQQGSPSREGIRETYGNPILYADYSDPDAIRVGDDFWMTASSFSNVPGLPILHSRDLVNWRLVNHALPRLVPEERYAIHRAGCGVWAPALRFHDGIFWIFYPDPDFGIYVIHTDDPTQPWSKPFLLKAGQGLIDPCPLWDGEKAYLIHGWAKSRSGICNLLTLHEMSKDASYLLDEGATVIDGSAETDWHTLEGPKLYKREGWYWIFAPVDGVAEGSQAVFRSRSIRGPYEGRKVLEQGETFINGPHQGAWIDTKDGASWFIHFQEKLPFGRIVHLQPMRWNDDGWPVMGETNSGATSGSPVSSHPYPLLSAGARQPIASSDDFSRPNFGLQWQWQSNPQEEWAILDPINRFLQLQCIPRLDQDSLWQSGALLMQKLAGPSLAAEVEVALQPDSLGDTAGLIVFGYDYFWIGLVKTAEGIQLSVVHCLNAHDGSPESLIESIPLPANGIHLKVQIEECGTAQFAYRRDTPDLLAFGPAFTVRESKWVGAKVGLFATAPLDSQSTGSARFKSFLVS